MSDSPKGRAVLAIDPGSEQSAYVWYAVNEKLGDMGIVPNEEMLQKCRDVNCSERDRLVVEQIESYGMPVGRSIFETVFWGGRFVEAWSGQFAMVPRRTVKLHLCNSARAKDSNVRQALIDRVGAPGTKKQPGFTYGLKRDLWQAFALAVTYGDGLPDAIQLP